MVPDHGRQPPGGPWRRARGPAVLRGRRAAWPPEYHLVCGRQGAGVGGDCWPGSRARAVRKLGTTCRPRTWLPGASRLRGITCLLPPPPHTHLCQGGQHLVSAVHDEVGAAGQRALRRRGPRPPGSCQEAEMGSVRFVHQQGHAAGVANCRQICEPGGGRGCGWCIHPLTPRTRRIRPSSLAPRQGGAVGRVRAPPVTCATAPK